MICRNVHSTKQILVCSTHRSRMEDQHYEAILKKLNITSKKIKSKSLGFFRLLDYRQKVLGAHDSCKYYVCAEIAHRQLKEPFSREHAAKLAGVSQSSFQEAFGQICGILNISFALDHAELAKLVNAEKCVETATSIETQFKSRVAAARTETARKTLNFDPTLLFCSSLILAGEVHRVPIDKLKLLEATSISPTRLDDNVVAMRELTLKLVAPSGNLDSAESEAEILGGAPPRKKAKLTASASKNDKSKASNAAAEHKMDYRPRITLDSPLDKELEDKIKQEDAIFVEKIMKVSMLCTPAQTLSSSSMTEKVREEEERLKEWKASIIEKAMSRETAPSVPKKQSTISFPKASSSNS